MKELVFQWDEGKAASNLAKHGVSFRAATGIFSNETIEQLDEREDYGELRWIAIGRVDLDVYRVIYTRRGGTIIRIISVQKASKYEREVYYRQLLT